MKNQQIELLKDISQLQDKHKKLRITPRSRQQEFLLLYCEKYLLNKQILPGSIGETLNWLAGSNINTEIKLSYVYYCLQKQIQLDKSKYPFVEMIDSWQEYYIKLSRQHNKIDLFQSVFQDDWEANANFSHLQEYIAYLNYIGPDLLQIIQKRVSRTNQTSSCNINVNQGGVEDQDVEYEVNHLLPQDVLQLLNASLPKVLFNIILPNDLLPKQLKDEYKNLECLYKNQNLEYYCRTNKNYQLLMKSLLNYVIYFDLKKQEMKMLMDVAFRYYYLYHHDQKHDAIQIFLKAFCNVSEIVKNALSDQFFVFFKILIKLGKHKFLDHLIQKYLWVRNLWQKCNQNSIAGYPKSSLNPYNSLNIYHRLKVPSGKTKQMFFQVFHQYSIFYFNFIVEKHDIDFRLFYVGDFQSKKSQRTQLYVQLKQSGEIKNSIIAVKKGLYLFQFDNSYSWIKSKSIRYQNIVLSPIEIQSMKPYGWINQFYKQVPTNLIYDEQSIFYIGAKKRSAGKGTKIYRNSGSGLANITFNDGTYNLKIKDRYFLYEYETEIQEGIIARANYYAEQKLDIRWFIDGERIQFQDGQSIFRTEGERESQQKQTNKIASKEQIGSKKKGKQSPQKQIQEEDRNDTERFLLQEQKQQNLFMPIREPSNVGESKNKLKLAQMANAEKERLLLQIARQNPIFHQSMTYNYQVLIEIKQKSDPVLCNSQQKVDGQTNLMLLQQPEQNGNPDHNQRFEHPMELKEQNSHKLIE